MGGVTASDSYEPQLTYQIFSTLIYACSKRGLVKLASKLASKRGDVQDVNEALPEELEC
ncbi:hypothetical protein MTR_3g053790 [Medicago truncatula]|uniref:Uncharacterized protein n=1 Tax=Medicago truncatula TaxID=3880 RepID=G7J008_MEDTR|nr:hypothetical protein MTR_3g053790 [Medicago truncatula]